MPIPFVKRAQLLQLQSVGFAVHRSAEKEGVVAESENCVVAGEVAVSIQVATPH